MEMHESEADMLGWTGQVFVPNRLPQFLGTVPKIKCCTAIMHWLNTAPLPSKLLKHTKLKTMKLQQGQIWRAGETYYRIVHLERLEVKYKEMSDPAKWEGTHHHVTKKEFCRLIKNATLVEKQSRPETSESAVPEE